MGIWDMEDGDFCHKLSDDTLMDSDGNLMHVMSDNMAMDMENGELHFISGYSSSSNDDWQSTFGQLDHSNRIQGIIKFGEKSVLNLGKIDKEDDIIDDETIIDVVENGVEEQGED